MSIPVTVTKEDWKTISHELKNNEELVCLDRTSHIKALLIGRERLLKGQVVKAKIIKGYEDAPKPEPPKGASTFQPYIVVTTKNGTTLHLAYERKLAPLGRTLCGQLAVSRERDPNNQFSGRDGCQRCKKIQEKNA
jgi:hypothetical protein